MTYAIKAENLGKRYLIGHRKKEPYSTLRDSLAHGVQNFWQRLRHPNIPAGDNQIEEFWALRDVSFEIKPGDRVGIIGRNGAGKSTLLKILSRITEPTTGKFTTRGRVASLLEVGTGFHPELTGRENIYLNGAILGMTRADVKRQFDAIVDFSGVEKFLDTPVKRYSSGMYVRLAFAVAAHLEPDILIVDEVLAVGDAEFQKKCLGKMEEVGKEGRTVVFVSHNMGAVRRLCDRGMVIEGGNLACSGSVLEAMQLYDKTSSDPEPRAPIKQGQKAIRVLNVSYCNTQHQPSFTFTIGELEEIAISYDAHCLVDAESSRIDLGINNQDGIRVAWFSTSLSSSYVPPQSRLATFHLSNFLLNVGRYTINVYCEVDNITTDWIQFSFPFEITRVGTKSSYNHSQQMMVPYVTEFELSYASDCNNGNENLHT